MSITLKPITKSNYWEVIELDAGDNGKFVANNAKTILESLFDNRNENTLRAVYHNKILVGLVYFYKYNNAIYINRFMIDKKFQNQGIGKMAFKKIIDFIKNNYNSKKIELSTNNPIAIHMYTQLGFEKMANKRSDNFYKTYKETLFFLNI